MKTLFCATFLLLSLSVGSVEAQVQSKFPYSKPPVELTDGYAKMEWSALHFWDAYDFATAEVTYPLEARREGFLVFTQTLYYTSEEVVESAIEGMLNKAARSEEGYWAILEMAEEVLYDPLSPMRNDLVWELYLHHAVGDRSPLDEVSRSRYKSLLKVVSRNQMGSVATDFEYTTANGRKGRLHDISAPLTLLYFYNPGCSECRYAREQLEASGYLNMLHQRGLIKVLAVYPDGDVAEWRKYLSENPSWWITSYDKGSVITRNDLYDLKAIPTFYLLDEEKRVIMKDPSVENLVAMLGRYCGR